MADTNTTLSYSTLLVAVADAIAIFETANYKLSAEFLTQSFYNTDSAMVWVPEYGGRVISSRVLQEICEGGTLSGTAKFPFSFSDDEEAWELSRNEIDLALAIHAFNFERSESSSGSIVITDTYDFEFIR